MIHLNFEIVNPFSNKFKHLVGKSGRFGMNKGWEANAYRTNSIITFQFDFTIRGDHAGLKVQGGLFGFEGEFHFYDSRHWDWKNDRWETYDGSTI